MKKGNRNDHSENSHVLVSFKESNTSQEGTVFKFKKKKCLTKSHIRPKYKYTYYKKIKFNVSQFICDDFFKKITK